MDKGILQKGYFSKGEIALFCSSVALILVSFVLFDRQSYLTLAASVIGAASLILNAKGNPIGQLLMVIFSLLYGIVSFRLAYYGEMITYMGMTAPMALFSLIAWIRHPYKGRRAEVAVNRIKPLEVGLMLVLTAAVTTLFFFILNALSTSCIVLSTISVATSFAAVYLTLRRSPYFALAYAANDIVLIALWSVAAGLQISYVSVIICFITFLINDTYGFINWLRIQKRQNADG